VAKFLIKANRSSGQLRITIPKALAELKGWEDVGFFMLEGDSVNTVKIWRFIDGESLKGAIKGDKSKQD